MTGDSLRRARLCLLPVVFAVLVESLFFAFYCAQELVFKGNADVKNHRFFLDKYVFARFLEKPSYPVGGKQRDLGYISHDTPEKWFYLLPPDGIMGWRMGKNVRALHYDKYLYVTNEQGFVSIGEDDFHHPLTKPRGKFRVFVLGGSSVFGMGARLPEGNLPAQILRALRRARPGADFEVINAGVGGYESGQELLYLQTELVGYGPDLVIVYDGWNDSDYNALILRGQEGSASPNLFKTTTHVLNDRRLDASFTVAGNLKMLLGVSAGRATRFLDGFATWYFVKGKVLDRLLPLAARTPKPGDPNYVDPLRYDPRSVRMYEDHLAAMAALAKYRGFKIALFLQPKMGVDGKKTLSREERELHRRIGDLPLRVGFYRDARRAFVRLGERFGPSACVKDVSRVFADVAGNVYADDSHLTEVGNKIVADRVVRELSACRSLPDSAAR